MSGGIPRPCICRVSDMSLFPMDSAERAGLQSGRLLALRCFTEQRTNRDRLISLAATTRRQ